MPFSSPRALVLLRVPRGGEAPPEGVVREAIARDRRGLSLPVVEDVAYRVAGPYPVELDGRALDEYVAWEV